MAQVTFYFFTVVDGGADLKIGSALRTDPDVDFENALEKLRSSVILDFFGYVRISQT
jgi:hypothetical protein